MNFFKKISNKKISTVLDECDNSKLKNSIKSKYGEHKPLPPSPPAPKGFLKDDSLLELNIPVDFSSSFGIPQPQSIRKQPLDANSNIKTVDTVIQSTKMVTATAIGNVACLERFSKNESKQETPLHAEVNDSSARRVHADISESHPKFALEFTENRINSYPFLQTQEEGEHKVSPLLDDNYNKSSKVMEPNPKESRNDPNANDGLPIDISTVSNISSSSDSLSTSGNKLSWGEEIKDTPILSIGNSQVLLGESKAETELNSADGSNPRSSHLSLEIAKFTPLLLNSNSDAVMIKTAVEQHNKQKPSALLESRPSRDDTPTENTEREQAVCSLAVEEPQNIGSSNESVENGILALTIKYTGKNQTNGSITTSSVAKRRSAHSFIPRKNQQTVSEELATVSKLPIHINKTRHGASSGIPLPSSRLSSMPLAAAQPAIIQESLTAISSPSSSSGSLGKSMRSISSASSSCSSDNSQHSEQQKGADGKPPVHEYKPLIHQQLPQSKIPIAAVVPTVEIARIVESSPASIQNNHISRLPKRNSIV